MATPPQTHNRQLDQLDLDETGPGTATVAAGVTPSPGTAGAVGAPRPTRRHVIAAGAAVVVLAGCRGTGPVAASAAGGSSAPAPLAKLSDVPVGGSASATSPGPDGKAAVVAQPTAGSVVAFSAICTHQGCTVAPAGNEYHCPCHGSVYDAFTGKVKSGPAPAPLASIPVAVQAGVIVPTAG